MVEGEWERVLDLLEEDRECLARRREVRGQKEKQGQESYERRRGEVMGKVLQWQVGKAAGRIISPEVASVESPEVMCTLRAKFVERGRIFPDSVTKGQSVDKVEGHLLGLERGTATGPVGMRPEFLIETGELLGEEDIRRLELHSLRCLNRAYPAWFHRCLWAVTTVSLYKTKERENTLIRPLGVASSFI